MPKEAGEEAAAGNGEKASAAQRTPVKARSSGDGRDDVMAAVMCESGSARMIAV
jgi:hypothetical protein